MQPKPADFLAAMETELARRERVAAGPLSQLWDKQRACVEDESTRLKAIITPRRAGKSFAYVGWVMADQLTHPGSQYAYVAKTRPTAKRTIWKKIVKVLNERYELDAKLNEGWLECRFPNGAELFLLGGDQANWTDRFRGPTYRGVGIDEIAFYGINVKEFVEEALEPATIDEDGFIFLMSSPGDTCEGYFYDICTGKIPGWGVYRWTTFDNPHMAEKWARVIDRKIKLNPDIVNSPSFRREYKGEWVENPQGKVYELAKLIPEYEFNPETDTAVCGVDFGSGEVDSSGDPEGKGKTGGDDMAYSAGVWSEAHHDFVVVESFKKTNQLLPDIAEELERLQKKYPGMEIVGDPAAKQLMFELQARFGIPIYDAEKTDKRDWIRVYNSDVATGRVKFVESSCYDLIKEQKQLKKVKKPGRPWFENPTQKNDACDGNLYSYRHSYPYRYKPVREGPKPGTPEHYEEMAKEYWEHESEMAQDRMDKMRSRRRR